jgi:DNA-binding transcriptional ArsR family regulator
MTAFIPAVDSTNWRKLMARSKIVEKFTLADPTHRAILDLLRDGPMQTTQMVEKFPKLSRFGVMKHLDCLQDAGLIQTWTEGRLRINSRNVAPLCKVLERWISKFEAFWASALLRVKKDSESGQIANSMRRQKGA